jgi:hypothetical protein
MRKTKPNPINKLGNNSEMAEEEFSNADGALIRGSATGFPPRR